MDETTPFEAYHSCPANWWHLPSLTIMLDSIKPDNPGVAGALTETIPSRYNGEGKDI